MALTIFPYITRNTLHTQRDLEYTVNHKLLFECLWGQKKRKSLNRFSLVTFNGSFLFILSFNLFKFTIIREICSQGPTCSPLKE